MSPTRRRAPSVLTSSSKRVRISDAIEVIGSSGDSHTIVHSVSSVDAKGELGKPCLRSTEKPVASSKQQSPTMKEKGPGKRGRGRPKKITTATGPIKRGRGRPKVSFSLVISLPTNSKEGPSLSSTWHIQDLTPLSRLLPLPNLVLQTSCRRKGQQSNPADERKASRQRTMTALMSRSKQISIFISMDSPHRT